MMPQSITDKTKKLLADPTLHIELHDLVVQETRELLSSIEGENFSNKGKWNQEIFPDRLSYYEETLHNLVNIFALFGYWADNVHKETILLPMRKLSNRIQFGSGMTNAWVALEWYPLLLLTYAVGIASVSSLNFSNLSKLFQMPVMSPSTREELPLLLTIMSEISQLDSAFKNLPNREKQYVPRSEYLFEKIQPIMDDLLFLDDEYDRLFDRFELLLALEHAHLAQKCGMSSWGPIGRFGWKHRGGHGSPFLHLLKDAKVLGENWEPLRGGFFDGSYEMFEKITSEFSQRLQSIHWQ